MRVFFLGVTVLLMVLASSCVPHKETVYYQDKGTVTDSIPEVIEQPQSYRVQIDDILTIQVKSTDQENVSIFNPLGESELNNASGERAYYEGFIIDLQGNIRIPQLGYINVLGMTVKEIENLLEQRLLEEEFKETANIFVTVRLAGLRYTTSGEINSVGTQTLFQERVNIMEAIANAGGLTEFGNATDVMIIRQLPVGQEIAHIDITDINIINSPYYYIQPNDMIYVKPRKIKALGLGSSGLQNATLLFSAFTALTTVVLFITR